MLSAAVLRTQPDGKLVSLAAAGSEAAFEVLDRRYRRMLLSYCRKLLRSQNTSEDVVQQALLNAWAALRAGTEVREVKAWLHSIARNQALLALRCPGPDPAGLDESRLPSRALLSDLDRWIFTRDTLAAIAALPELQREAITRTAIDGYSYEQVAATLGVSHDAVRGLVYRARTALRSAVGAMAPAPVVLWAAGRSRTGTPGVREAVAGGGSVGLLKGGAVVLVASAVAMGGTVGGALAPRWPGEPAWVSRTASRPQARPQIARRSTVTFVDRIDTARVAGPSSLPGWGSAAGSAPRMQASRASLPSGPYAWANASRPAVSGGATRPRSEGVSRSSGRSSGQPAAAPPEGANRSDPPERWDSSHPESPGRDPAAATQPAAAGNRPAAAETQPAAGAESQSPAGPLTGWSGS